MDGDAKGGSASRVTWRVAHDSAAFTSRDTSKHLHQSWIRLLYNLSQREMCGDYLLQRDERGRGQGEAKRKGGRGRSRQKGMRKGKEMQDSTDVGLCDAQLQLWELLLVFLRRGGPGEPRIAREEDEAGERDGSRTVGWRAE